MSAFYDGLSMRGSGEDIYEITRHVECPDCGWNGDLDMNTTGYTAHWSCSTCDIEHEIEVNE